MKSNILYLIDRVLDFLIKRGKTQVVLSYLAIVAFLLGFPLVEAKINWGTKTAEIAFGSISALLLLTLTIITIPVIFYLTPYGRKREKELFQTNYLPYFNKIFEYLSPDKYDYWAYHISVSGTPYIRIEQYGKLNNLIRYLKSRPSHLEFGKWDDLIKNMLLLVEDLISVLDIELTSFGDEVYTIRRFYKRDGRHNPNYSEDLKKYNELVYLIADLIFELTRLSNYILDEIRKIEPDFLLHTGRLIIPDKNQNDFTYQDNEISNSPYPGLDEFIKIRPTRGHKYSSDTTIVLELLK